MWFGQPRRDALPVQLYGKLPLAKDFLRQCGARDAGARVRAWLDGAYGGAEPRELAWPADFLLTPRDGDSAQGSVWPSADAGGLRRFPFALWVVRRRRAVDEDFDEQQRTWSSPWGELRAVRAEADRCADGRSLLARMSARAVDPGRRVPVEAAPVRQETWTESLWPGRGLDGLVEALRRLAALRAELRGGPLRLPLVGDLPFEPQVVAWLASLRSIGLAPPRGLPSLVLPQGDPGADRAAFLVVCDGPLGPHLGPWLAPPTDGGLGVADLAEPRPARAGSAEPAPESLPSLAASLRGTLLQFGE